MPYVELFFANHYLTKLPNKLGHISLSLKQLFLKLFQYDPLARPTVSELLLADDWLLDPCLKQSVEEYQTQMRDIWRLNHNLDKNDDMTQDSIKSLGGMEESTAEEN